MKAVVLEVSDRELEDRRRRGLDRFDEMWEGVLHMAPSPLYEHQRIVMALGRFLSELSLFNFNVSEAQIVWFVDFHCRNVNSFATSK